MTDTLRHVGRLRESLDAIDTLLVNENTHSAAFERWQARTRDSIRIVKGEASRELKEFTGLAFWNMRVSVGSGGPSWHSSDQERYTRDLERARTMIEDLLADLPADLPAPNEGSFDFWSLLHPEIVAHAKPRFDNGQYADSVEAALKEVNDAVKARFRKTGQPERNGADLMNAAFSPNNPIILLDDLATVSGQDVQRGYMQIYAGAMIGIRNPKAHGNLDITPKRAIHLLFLASLLRGRLEDPV